MLYLSQLISFSELQALISESHTGLELIDFSVGMNLDRMEEYLLQWQDTLPRLGNPPLTHPRAAFSGSESHEALSR